MKKNKESIIQYSVAAGVVLLLIVAVIFGYNLLFNKKEPTANKEVEVSKIRGLGSTPEETLTKFISTTGNMGNQDSVTIDNLTKISAISGNSLRRYKSYTDSIKFLSTSSPLNILNNEKYISEYGQKKRIPEFYAISDIKVSKGTKGKTIYNSNFADGSATGVDLYASFISTKTIFRPKTFDSSSDGTIVKIQNKERFDNIKFTLIRLGKNDWRVFSIDTNAEIGSRFSIWNTQSRDYIDETKDTIVSEMKPIKGK